jgi:enoyl-CoA hydratase/carnithine racemase
MSAELGVEIQGHVAVLEIRRGPENYFDRIILGEIADVATSLQGDGDIRAIVLCSEGKHFCAGANFASHELETDRDASSRKLYTEAIRLFDLELPIIAAVQGSAVGGGLGLACAADFRVGSASSRFTANFAALGFHQGFGLSVTLPRIVGHQVAQDLLYTGRRVTGQRAFEVGLVDRLVTEGQEREAAISWAQEIAASAPLAVRAIKRTLRHPLIEQVRAALELELSEQSRLWKTKDSVAGIAANLARETPTFTGE